MKKKNNIVFVDIKEISTQAMREGQKLDLKDCAYDTLSVNAGRNNPPPLDYYYFLAGLVRSQKLTHILEIGTHMGGAIKSMSKGLNDRDIKSSKLLTIDIVSKNESGFKDYPNIKRIKGNVLNGMIAKEIEKYFKGDIDLLFIDSHHAYGHVKSCIALYANRLKPKYVILDDIHYNKSMERLWKEVTVEFKGKALDLTAIINRGACGIGLIYWGQDFRRNWQFVGSLLRALEILRGGYCANITSTDYDCD